MITSDLTIELISFFAGFVLISAGYFLSWRKSSKKKNKMHKYKRVNQNLEYFKKLYHNLRFIDEENLDQNLKTIRKLTLGVIREPLRSLIEDFLDTHRIDNETIDKVKERYIHYQRKFNEFKF